jgi:cell division protein FtsQ
VAREESFSAGEPIVARRHVTARSDSTVIHKLEGKVEEQKETKKETKREEKTEPKKEARASSKQEKWQVPESRERPIRRASGYQKVLPLGVSDSGQDAANGGRSRWARLMGILVFLVALGVGGYFAAEPVANLLERPLSSVTVEGEFLYVSKKRTMELISAELDGDFLQLDLMRLKGVLESDPWVEYAALGRRWPDILRVKIVEQKPIALWGEKSFMNQRGEIIHVDSVASLTGFPRLDGDEGDAPQIMRQYQDLSQLLRTRGLEIVALSCDQKKSWRMTLNGGTEIVVGRDQVMEKIQRFLIVYDQHLSSLWSDIKTIDVRYTNGIAVQWMPESGASKRFIKSS